MAVYAYLVLVLALHAFSEADATSYASLESSDGFFKLQWTYNNSKLIFKMTFKTTGWCAVGFTKTADGRNMKDYDIAVGGFAASAGYIVDYWSDAAGPPSKDATQNYDHIKASEVGGVTVVEFSRDAVTGDNKDVQFMNDTEVKVVWACRVSSDGNAGLSKHSRTEIFPSRYNLIAMAKLAMQSPSTTVGMQPPSTTVGMQPPSTTVGMQPPLTTVGMQPSGIQPSTTMITPTSSKDLGGPTTAPPSYASLASSDGFFKLQWTYDNSKLIFKMTCKTTGWCAVGFTTTADGRGMKNYDIAVGGYASGAGYIADYYSTTVGQPPKDTTQNIKLVKASEDDGVTVVEFSRDALTGDDKDGQFKDDTEVIVVWALHSSSDANTGLSKHTKTGILSGKHNLIKEAMAAMQPTPKDSASVIVSSVSVLVILSAYLLSF